MCDTCWVLWCVGQIRMSQWMALQRRLKRDVNIGQRKIRTIRDIGPQGKTVLQEEGSGHKCQRLPGICEESDWYVLFGPSSSRFWSAVGVVGGGEGKTGLEGWGRGEGSDNPCACFPLKRRELQPEEEDTGRKVKGTSQAGEFDPVFLLLGHVEKRCLWQPINISRQQGLLWTWEFQFFMNLQISFRGFTRSSLSAALWSEGPCQVQRSVSGVYVGEPT